MTQTTPPKNIDEVMIAVLYLKRLTNNSNVKVSYIPVSEVIQITVKEDNKEKILGTSHDGRTIIYKGYRFGLERFIKVYMIICCILKDTEDIINSLKEPAECQH